MQADELRRTSQSKAARLDQAEQQKVALERELRKVRTTRPDTAWLTWLGLACTAWVKAKCPSPGRS
jgi:hypothetical protein